MNTKTLISNSGGASGFLVEFNSMADLRAQVAPGAFARVSYTNHGAHARTQTWYPVRALAEVDCDFQFETSYRQ